MVGEKHHMVTVEIRGLLRGHGNLVVGAAVGLIESQQLARAGLQRLVCIGRPLD